MTGCILLGMECSDGSSDDSTDGWITVKGKKPKKKFLTNEADDGHGHGTTGGMTGVTNVNKHMTGVTNVYMKSKG